MSFVMKSTGAAAPEATLRKAAEDQMLIAPLTTLLADVVAFSFRAWGFHWNVTGKDFQQYHELFGDIYEDAIGSIDPLAENIRKMGGRAPFGLNQYSAMSSIDDTDITGMMPADLATDLLAQNDTVLAAIAKAFTLANAMNQQGIANFLAERQDMHQKWAWQLRSSIGVDVPFGKAAEKAAITKHMQGKHNQASHAHGGGGAAGGGGGGGLGGTITGHQDKVTEIGGSIPDGMKFKTERDALMSAKNAMSSAKQGGLKPDQRNQHLATAAGHLSRASEGLRAKGENKTAANLDRMVNEIRGTREQIRSGKLG
jgi:starvation-inducible DNA-binding protein